MQGVHLYIPFMPAFFCSSRTARKIRSANNLVRQVNLWISAFLSRDISTKIQK